MLFTVVFEEVRIDYDRPNTMTVDELLTDVSTKIKVPKANFYLVLKDPDTILEPGKALGEYFMEHKQLIYGIRLKTDG